jgi:predicted phosphohydrolase
VKGKLEFQRFRNKQIEQSITLRSSLSWSQAVMKMQEDLNLMKTMGGMKGMP